MQRSNNLCSHSGRRIGAAEQAVLPTQLNKAEGTAPFIRSHSAPRHTPFPALGLSLCNLHTLPGAAGDELVRAARAVRNTGILGDELPGSPRRTQDSCSLFFSL